MLPADAAVARLKSLINSEVRQVLDRLDADIVSSLDRGLGGYKGIKSAIEAEKRRYE